ncbi:hypothetical protein VTO42DRAFT_1356 [Malbranchea cinnamomea]
MSPFQQRADTVHGRPDQVDSASQSSTSPKRRKRSRKGDTEKRYECKHDGCGKSYSRAEHLYRHQLNHNPKEIYHCGFPNCYRTFVRQDLCVRHRERHTTHGSQLQKRDSFPYSGRAAPPPSLKHVSPQEVARAVSPTNGVESAGSAIRSQVSPTETNNMAMVTNYLSSAVRSGVSSSTASLESHFQPPTPRSTYAGPDPQAKRPSNTNDGSISHTTASHLYSTPHPPQYGSYDNHRYHNSSFGSSDISREATHQPHLRQMPASGPSVPASAGYVQPPGGMTPATAHHCRVNSYPDLQMSTLTPSGQSNGASNQAPNAAVATISNGLGTIEPVTGVIDASVADLDSMAAYALPVFGGETLNRSPFSMGDDFTSWLFNENPTSSSISYQSVPGSISGYSDPFSAQYLNQYYPTDAAFGGYLANVVQHQDTLSQQQQQQDPMSVTSILDSGPPQCIISEGKRNELIYLMQTRFNEADHTGVKKRKDALLSGNMDADNHILSLHMIQTYIASYWRHFDEQVPILHKPTFTADKTPNLLLLIVIAIGAVTLEKDQGQVTMDAAAELANFIAWHLRWEIFQDADFRPPARLWVFQTLLLLEFYEKMYSTRALHERAHIHHDTTLTLMRRGSSLLGRATFDSPSSLREDRHTTSTTGSRANSASEPGAGEESWGHWIKAEATRRVAFATFALDSTHATMFGHSAKMVAHELRLPLPCDEALWSATSAAEVARVQSSLYSNGVRPVMFLDALKKTLNGQKVQTNSFGRTIIMAGLLSVSWHMNQRDLQVSSLGVAQTLGGREKWRSSLLRAFDYWKRDFDEAASQPSPSSNYSPAYRQQYPTKEDAFCESRTVLHHLAHMASHVDVVDCQIFAGASRLLGRSITPKDYSTAREKMTQHWATKASARDATFYALKFLCHLLMPEDPWRQSISPQPGARNEYSARDDYMLSRPWVLYYAALVVWCYGYALDGPISPSPPPELTTPAEQRQDMYAFLQRVGGVRSPDDLGRMRHRNRCMGLLMVLRDMFSKTRWELLQEAATLLGSCIEKLKGSTASGAAGSS